MTDIIDEDQTGFISGRQTQDNIRRMIHIVEETQRTKNSAILVSVDAEKAFDSVNWIYLYNAAFPLHGTSSTRLDSARIFCVSTAKTWYLVPEVAAFSSTASL